YYITGILRSVIDSGTGRGANIGKPAAGKTGTTSNYKDAWFAGYTPELVTVVWMGNPESSEPMDPINDRVVVGGTYPADIWREFMTLALADSPINDFTKPAKELLDIEVCTESGLLPVFWCPEDVLGWRLYLKNKDPDDICDIHNKVEVPDAAGLSLDEARLIFDELFIEITGVEEFNDTYNQGIIFDQSPPAGSMLESLTGEKLSIILYVSKGERSFDMPDLTSRKVDDAEGILKNIGMLISEIIYEFSSTHPVDLISGQTPPAGSLVTKSTGITIYVSKGENPESIIPDIIGRPEDEALVILANAGFEQVSPIYEESEETIGTVFSQVPESGIIYDKSDEVIIKVSIGIMVPDIVGLDSGEAIITLEDKGFIVLLLPDQDAIGLIIGQDPESGSYLDYGSTISIEVEQIVDPEEEDGGG
ncbi:MAG: PASTA domain-containing protein, partial [Candidatus Humimicrobiaceae bacterium]